MRSYTSTSRDLNNGFYTEKMNSGTFFTTVRALVRIRSRYIFCVYLKNYKIPIFIQNNVF